jgi:hypothetical protein
MIDASIQTEIQQLRIIYNQNPFIKNYWFSQDFILFNLFTQLTWQK